jgi:integrase
LRAGIGLAVEAYIAQRLKSLSPRSVNMSVVLAAQIMEGAVERELLQRNPFQGERRRAREGKSRRSYLDSAEQVEALLAAAGELDDAARADRQHVQREVMLATLTFAGLRIGELLALRWRHVDLANGWLTVGESKTDAGIRRIRIRAALRDALGAVKPVDVSPMRWSSPPRTAGHTAPRTSATQCSRRPSSWPRRTCSDAA